MCSETELSSLSRRLRSPPRRRARGQTGPVRARAAAARHAGGLAECGASHKRMVGDERLTSSRRIGGGVLISTWQRPRG